MRRPAAGLSVASEIPRVSLLSNKTLCLNLHFYSTGGDESRVSGFQEKHQWRSLQFPGVCLDRSGTGHNTCELTVPPSEYMPVPVGIPIGTSYLSW